MGGSVKGKESRISLINCEKERKGDIYFGRECEQKREVGYW